MSEATILVGDVRDRLRDLPADSVQCCVTSPPYWGLRDYGVAGQLGLERTPEEYVANMVEVFREVRRVLRPDGTLWLNLGDSYAAQRGGTTPPAQTVAGGVGGIGDFAARRGMSEGYSPSRDCTKYGLKHKDLVGIPWRVAFALQADGWWLRSDIVWSKPNPMPESVTDRPTKAHEYLFLLSKSASYFYDADAISEEATGRDPGNVSHRGADAFADGDEHHRTKAGLVAIGARETRNRRTVWTIATQPFPGAHFAVMPQALVEPCILAGSKPGDTILDPFAGSGTVGVVALKNGREFVGIDLNPAYAAMAKARIEGDAPLLNRVTEAA